MQNEGYTGPSRRNLVKGAAWAVPVVAAAAAAPAAAVSLRKDPGINGWVTVGTNSGLFNRCNKTVTFNSTGSGSGPDGAPYGLYIYDINPDDFVEDAEMIIWLPNNINNPSGVTWSTNSGHSNCWSSAAYIGSHQKSDGAHYHGYKWTYTCPIDPADAVEGSDGESRLFLGNFHVSADYTLSSSCSTYHYWTQRRVTISDEFFCFERKIGSSVSGTPPTHNCSSQVTPYSTSGGGSLQRTQSVEMDVPEGESEMEVENVWVG